LAEFDQQTVVMNWIKMTWKIPASCAVLTAEQSLPFCAFSFVLACA